MRKITKEAVEALTKRKTMSISNTRVKNNKMYLFDNLIAWIEDGNLFITNCGYFTTTTKERLNGLPNVSIHQCRGTWYLNGKEWDGSKINVGKV